MPSKAVPSKKPLRRRVAVRRVAKTSPMPVPEPNPVPEPMPGPGTARSRVIYFAGCKNCDHLPLGANAVIAVLIAIIFTLSAMLMAASVTLTRSSAPTPAVVASR